MLPEESKKELIAQYLVLWMAAMAGVKAGLDELDHGVDVTLKEVKKFLHKDKTRYMNSGKSIDFQLKCTTEKSIEMRDGAVGFDLESKNFNDLVQRLRQIEVIPLYLIVVILPENPELWYESNFEKLILSAKRLWYVPDKEVSLTNNKRTVRINIPTNQIVSPEFFSNLF